MNLSIATWNVNGIRARKDTFLDWLKVNSPDILCLQEIKCVNDDFPIKRSKNLDINVM